MATLANATQILRSPGDPRIESSGPSSLTGVDRLARALGWFSFALGAAELAAPRRITSALGLEGRERLVRAYGAREIAAGIPTLSYDKHIGLISRIVGDVVDIATLAPALRAANPKRKNAVFAMGAVGVVTLLDIAAAAGVLSRHRRSGEPRDYSDRSGLPRGNEASRGLARDDFRTAPDTRAEPVSLPPPELEPAG